MWSSARAKVRKRKKARMASPAVPGASFERGDVPTTTPVPSSGSLPDPWRMSPSRPSLAASQSAGYSSGFSRLHLLWTAGPGCLDRLFCTEQLAALHPDQFVGVHFDDASPLDAVVTFATGWINDLYAGRGPTDPLYGLYGNPNDGTYVANQPIVMGEAWVTVLPAPPPVDINQYAGTWYEQGSVKQFLSTGLVNTRAVYMPQLDGTIMVENSGNSSGPNGPAWKTTGKAVAVNAANTRLAVSFSGEPTRDEPGNYWILDYAPDYSWAIVSDASGTSGTILTREHFPSEAEYTALVARAYRLGVRGAISPTAQFPIA